MLDKLINELEKRKELYDHLLENYKLFFKLTTLSVADVYIGHLKSIGSDAPNTIQDMCAFIRQTNVVNIYPYIDISLRMLLCTSISNCSTERSFSALKRVKSYLRSCSKENRLNSLAMMTSYRSGFNIKN
ncbi:zinc finger MYM-type protein 1-like [Aphis craccivora]|uniref:Zinc finger MYM-type protein 1-like n=1 Tax=Aphis craccivora TaxID=307492 RepID=A0A6G0Z8P9_APHCR|nr:zinc finger MYM-type protein 1-like [Aphis craccivora]